MTPENIAEWLPVGAYMLVHVMAVVSLPKWWPAWIAKLLQSLAGNYGNAKNQ
jgi:hypothetical protein